MTKYVVGLSGGIGSGKTSVSDRFAEHGITVADSDVVSREVVAPGMPAHSAIRKHFGESILLADGSLDRAAMRNIVFTQPAELKWLEAQTHGPIMQELRSQLNDASSPYAILVLSAGGGRSPLISRMLLIDVPEAMQLERAALRDGSSLAQIRAIMKSQPSREQRLTWADDVINNDGSVENLFEKVDHLHQQYLTLAT